jgi:hypothetical protein
MWTSGLRLVHLGISGKRLKSLKFVGSRGVDPHRERDVLPSFPGKNLEFFDFPAAINDFDGGLARGVEFEGNIPIFRPCGQEQNRVARMLEQHVVDGCRTPPGREHVADGRVRGLIEGGFKHFGGRSGATQFPVRSSILRVVFSRSLRLMKKKNDAKIQKIDAKVQ